MTTRDPLAGMPEDIREDFSRAPAAVRDAYLIWWANRPNKAAAHRDTWPAYRAGWQDLFAKVASLNGATLRRS